MREFGLWQEARSKRFGTDYVRAEFAYRRFREKVGPELAGYTEIRSGNWVRPAHPDIFHIVEFRRVKAHYNFFWGVSLTYMPEVKRGKLKWHRTLKSARYDLHDDFVEEWRSREHPSIDEEEAIYVDFDYGKECFELDLERAWSRLRRPIQRWLEAASTPKGVAERARRQCQGGYSHHCRTRGWCSPSRWRGSETAKR